MWTPELIPVLVECYVALMHEADAGSKKKRVYKQVAEEVHSRTGVSVMAEQVRKLTFCVDELHILHKCV